MKIYFDADAPPFVDDLAPMPAPAAPVRRQRRGLRNWQKFAICYVPIMAGGALILYDYDGAATAAVGLAVWLTTMLVIFVLAGRAGRL
jgi:hypothetical protein